MSEHAEALISGSESGFTADNLPDEATLSEASRRAIARGLKPFVKGKSGNPSGYSRTYAAARKIFQDHSEALAQRLLELSLGAEDERVAAMCTITALGIAGLKPKDFDPTTEKDATPLDYSKLSAAQRAQMRELIEAMQGSAASVEDA